ncbi:DUF2800 domain-containing protein [candidate division KSB1 bacterium]|nr:DUF2800 domain-containing protein [candidate division KSB1 bacterium]
MFETVATEIPRILACNGSRLLGGSMPPSNSDPIARDEGIAAHWLIQSVFRGADAADLIGKKAPNGITITDAIARSTADFLTHVAQNRQTSLCQGVEQDFELTGFNWRIVSRPDHYAFNGATLWIDDFKHGFRVVEAAGNWVLLVYAISVARSIAQQIGVMPHHIVLSIHQPRVPHPLGTVRSIRLTGNELQQYAEYLDSRLTALDSMLHTGPHCHRCANATICPALRTAGFNAVDVSQTAHAESITDDAISKELDILDNAEKLLKARKKQLEDLAIHRLKQGAIIENYSMDRNYSNADWIEGFSSELISALVGVDITKPARITPTQAITAGGNKTIINQFSARKETGLKLTRVTADAKAKRMFGKGL